MVKTIPLIQPLETQNCESGRPFQPADVIKDISHKDLEGVNLLFINMPLRETAVPNVTPEGPALMGTNVRDNYGVNATIIDLNAYRILDEIAKERGLPNGRHKTHRESFELIEKHIKVYGEPDVVALSGMITTLGWQETISSFVKQLLPDSFLVSGGGLATDLKTGLFNYIPELDAVAHSEGDDVIVKICHDAKIIRRNGFQNALNSGKLNPYYLGNINGRHRFMYAGYRPRNLDAIPFADLELLREDVDGFKVLDYYLNNALWGLSANNSSAAPFTMTKSATAVSTRGCPHGCTYCDRQAQGERNWGFRSAEHLHRQVVAYIERYGIDFMGFPDDNFAVTRKRIIDMVPLFEPLGLKWGTHARLDETAGLVPKPGSNGLELIFEDPLRVSLMAKMGCAYIGLGPESANAKVLKALGKGGFTLKAGFVPVRVDGNTYMFPKAMYYGVKHILESGIHSNCTWIMGSPTETIEDLKETVAFIMWQEELYPQFGISPEAVNKNMFTLTYYPGTEMIREPKVQDQLVKVFGLKIDPVTLRPVCDENFRQYCLQLDDATKVLHDPKTGQVLHFSEMTDDQFLQAREYVDSGQIFKILDM